MGMDVYGKGATTERGEYFRNNVWWWRPLWNYCEEVFPECQNIDGHSNSGDGFGADKARELAECLLQEIASGRTKKYEDDYNAHLASLPKEKCDFCNGVGIVQVKESWPDYVEGEVKFRDPCNACNGTREKEPWEKHYPFSVENVQEFADFLKESGGFEIC